MKYNANNSNKSQILKLQVTHFTYAHNRDIHLTACCVNLSFEGSLKETKTVAVRHLRPSHPSTSHSLYKLPQNKLTGPPLLKRRLVFAVYLFLLDPFASNKGVFFNIVHAN